MTAGARQAIGRALNSRQEIADLLARPTWNVAELFEHDPNADSISSERPTMESLSKLIKQAAFSAVENNEAAKEKLLSELETQLQFVEHLSSVDTDGIEPLVRLSSEPQVIDFEDAVAAAQSSETAPETNGGWQPSRLAAVNDGDYYVVREGLRRDD